MSSTESRHTALMTQVIRTCIWQALEHDTQCMNPIAKWFVHLESNPMDLEVGWHDDWLGMPDSRECPCWRMPSLLEMENVHKIGF